MNIERLQHLITILEKIPSSNFDLATWGEFTDVDPTQPECGTACCAIGWACNDPKFQSEGLGWFSFAEGLMPEFDNAISWEAVGLFFWFRFR